MAISEFIRIFVFGKVMPCKPDEYWVWKARKNFVYLYIQ